MRLLVDEHLTPRLVQWAAEIGVYGQSVPHVGLGGKSDAFLWTYAFEHELTVATTNARDFIDLLNVDIHAGLIVMREGGLTRVEQWDRLKPVLLYVLSVGDPGFMVNRLIEIHGVGDFAILDMP